jgi:hypothetical protein
MRRGHLLNYAHYQIGWFACVPGGASHRPWTGCLIALSLPYQTLISSLLHKYASGRLKEV